MKLATSARMGSCAAARRHSATTVPIAPSAACPFAPSRLFSQLSANVASDRADADRGHQLAIDLRPVAVWLRATSGSKAR